MTTFFIFVFVVVVLIRYVVSLVSRQVKSDMNSRMRDSLQQLRTTTRPTAAGMRRPGTTPPPPRGFRPPPTLMPAPPTTPPQGQQPPPPAPHGMAWAPGNWTAPRPATPPAAMPPATPPAPTPPASKPEREHESETSSLDSSLSTSLGSSSADLDHNPIMAGPQLVALTPDLKRRVLEYMDQGYEVMAVRIVCDETHAGILDAQKTVRHAAGLPSPY